MQAQLHAKTDLPIMERNRHSACLQAALVTVHFL